MKILFAGQVGESLPPLYAGVPKRALLLAKEWREKNSIDVGICFTYRHNHEDDLGAKAQYFFEYREKPNTLKKLTFLLRAVCLHPFSYFNFLFSAQRLFHFTNKEVILYGAYAVFLEKVVRTYKPDIIVAESGLHRSVYAALVANKFHIPYVLETYAEVHDPSIMYLGSEQNRVRFWREFLTLPERIIVPSHYCGKGPRMYAPEGKVKMVYATTLQVDTFAHDTRTQEEARAHFNLPIDMFFVIAVGSYTFRKGHDHLIEAVANLRKKDKKVSAVLCGEGDYTWLKKLAEEKGILDAVFFFQNLSEDKLRLLFKSADLYCDASNTPRACLGIALTEGLATHLPAIVYNVAGLPEVVADGVNGFHVPLNDISKLGEAIDRFHTMSPEERRVFGDHGFQRAQKLFDMPHIASDLLTELTHIVTHTYA